MSDHVRFRRYVKNAQWKIAHLDFELCAGSLILCTAIADDRFLITGITVSDVVEEVWN